MTGRYWFEFALNNFGAWYLTFLIYSTCILGSLAGFARTMQKSAATESMIWKFGIIAGPGLAFARVVVEHVGVNLGPAGPEIFTVAGAAGWAVIDVSVAALILAGCLVLRFVHQAARERHVIGSRRPVTDPRAISMLRSVLQDAPGPLPRLTDSDQIIGPVAIGNNEICVPRGMFDALRREAARAVLAHEVAHLRRRDSVWGTFAQVMDRLFFLQPLQGLASRRIRETAEFLADDHAVRSTGDPSHLVDALTSFARSTRQGVALPGFVPGSLLVRRVARVLAGSVTEPTIHRSGMVLLVVVILVTALAAPAAVPACDCRWLGL